MVKIRIEDEHGNVKEFEYENVEFSQEIGKKLTYDAFGSIVDILPNGQSVLQLKAYSGCSSYNDFRATEVVDL